MAVEVQEKEIEMVQEAMFDLAFESEDINEQDKEYRLEAYQNAFESMELPQVELKMPYILESIKGVPNTAFSENSIAERTGNELRGLLKEFKIEEKGPFVVSFIENK
eukprot:TRINITY_DN3782_c0_g1_i2.p1 TRINITY_DN3782_c0_g1~~TRINITY_DN3782_c0_g1_i2.p1  ORF type:complete len:107 (-),score=33.40 TRINITY_DN3782_c0_g1_i2:10-330(-)